MARSKKTGRRVVSVEQVKMSSVEKRQTGGRSNWLNLPDGVTFFKPDKACIKRVDILAYEIPKNNFQPRFEEGDLWYELTYWVHKELGPDGRDTVVCPKKMANKDCPICELATKKRERGDDWEDFKDLLPKRRQLFNIIDTKSPDDIQVYDSAYPIRGAYKSVGNLLDFRLANMDEDDERLGFSNCVDGKSVEIGFEEDSFGANKFYKPVSVDFIKRKAGDYEDSIIDDLCCLDEALIMEDYKTIEKLMYAEDIDEEEDVEEDVEEEEEVEEVKPRRGRKVEEKKEEEEEEEEEEEVEEEVEKEEVEVKPTRRGRGRKVEEEDEEEEEEEEEEEVEEVKPRRGRGRKVEKEETEEDEEEDIEEEDIEEEEEVKPKRGRKVEKEEASPKKSSKDGEECPFGHNFGEADEHKDCDKCDKWEECDIQWQKNKNK